MKSDRKQATVCKASQDITDEQLARIHRYTRRELAKNELFVFSVILCDNEIDRDGERFPLESLEKLAELYKGKTGVFDHAPRAENQSARIFDTAVEAAQGMTLAGEARHRLRAWAYMAQCDKNADLILEIDAGIKKEVSVGCAVESVQCSVCGEDQRSSGCTHVKGQAYDGKICHHLLVGPTDAYEWSFVAVPAQPGAGVTKTCRGESGALPIGQVAVSGAKLEELEKLAELGARYHSDLQKKVTRMGLLGLPGILPGVWKEIAGKLGTEELEALGKSFEAAARERYPLSPQLGGGGAAAEDRGEFCI